MIQARSGRWGAFRHEGEFVDRAASRTTAASPPALRRALASARACSSASALSEVKAFRPSPSP